MKKLLLFAVILMALITQVVHAGDVNAGHFLFMAKKIFPEKTDISVFISKETLQVQRSQLERASAQYQLKTNVYLVESNLDVGKNIKKLNDNDILIVMDSELLTKKSTQLYILKNCKAKQISLITSSREFSTMGALLGVISAEDQIDLVVNLKHNEHLKSKFNDGYLKEIGITEVIQ